MKRTLRIFLSNTCANQTFQRDDAEAPAAAEVAEGEAAKGEGEAAKAAAAAATSGSGDDKIPSWTLRIEGRLMEPAFRSRAASSQAATAAAVRAGAQRFSNLVRTVVVELQRDAALYPAQSNIVEWHRPMQTALPDRASAATGPAGTGEPPLISAGEPSLDGLEIKRSGSSPVKARIVLYPAHTPERYALAPELAALLDVREETRAGIIAALWGYVKARSLLDENDRRYIRCDEALGRIFKTERIAFHHVPEVINRHLHPAQPIVLEYWVRTDVAEHKHQTAYDIELDLDDWATRKAREKVMDAFEPAGEAAAEIAELDDRVSLHARECE
jgi:SWI/SNF-related matrix-associated actin-dependent regulator of chromatin subfamily D